MHRIDQLENDPHLAATGFFRHLHDIGMGELVLPSAPLRFDGQRAQQAFPPRLGEHTLEVLREAGLPQETLDALLATRAAMQHNERTTP